MIQIGIPPYKEKNINRIIVSEKAFSASECNNFLTGKSNLKNLLDFILEINEHSYNFDLSDLRDLGVLSLKNNQGIGWNIALGNDEITSTRKLVFFLFLSDPKNYQGGKIIFDPANQEFSQDIGTFVIFPAYQLYMIEPVSAGECKILSGCLYGNHFK